MTDAAAPAARRLTRSADQRVLAGVCGGIAAHTALDATAVRLAFVLVAVLGGAGAAAYLLAWIVIPGPDGGAAPAERALARLRRPA